MMLPAFRPRVMSGILDRLVRRARQRFAPLPDAFRPTELIEVDEDGCDQLIYRLRRWPRLPSCRMTTDLTRTLSVMSTRPVNRRWILDNSSLPAREVDSMLRYLVEQDAVEVTDAGNFRPHTFPA